MLINCLFKELNKFKKRKFHTMKNLLTGTTDVQPDLVRVIICNFHSIFISATT